MGPVLVIVGAAALVISLFVLLPWNYILSLLFMFVAVVLIGIGVAFTKEVDKSLDAPREDCYYCSGSGKVEGDTCPRCGGTGLARPDD